MTSCEGLLGLSEPEVLRRLGMPSARREVDPDTWLVFRSKEMVLRVRLAGPAPGRVASWSATFERSFPLLSQAARAVGLWPAAAPDEEASGTWFPLVRRPLPCPESGRTYTLTATVRHGSFAVLSVFDEAPDWL
ncbi:MAG: hypothetical protein Q8W46_13670 [Candidatus Palauibacterales bacterium]|nr:hypothetical protein [Candidatus Palauibacterales bacterium]